MKTILGLSAYYHDSAAALIVDGRVAAAAQEERFSRVKHDHRFPTHAVKYCLKEAGLRPDQIDHVVFYEKPFMKFERLLETYVSVAPMGFRSFCMAMPQWIHEKLQLPRQMDRELGHAYTKPFVFLEHHESHAASAFFPSPFREAAIVTIDGVGEWASATVGHGRDNRIELREEMRFPHSLGLLYSAFTYFCGFKVNSGEYKLMGLAPFGVPKYEELILSQLLDLKDDGSFRLDLSYFNYCAGLTMTSQKFDRLFGGVPRKPESVITSREADLAASVQRVTETIMLRTAAHAHRLTGSKNLCLAGGVALNCVGNGRLLRESPFERIWVQPASGDAGGALGAALFVWYQLLENPREVQSPDSQQGSLLGPAYSTLEIESVLVDKNAVFRRFHDENSLCDAVAKLVAAGMIVAWMQGRMEFGPRALGSRSILGDARSPEMQRQMNLKIKFRESFRPFAPIVLGHRASEFFGMKPGEESPYMLIVAPVLSAKGSEPRSGGDSAGGLDRIKGIRSTIPAVTHVDGSARVQTVDEARNPRLFRLLEAFSGITGCPIMINTSFNVRGEPVVCSPEDAYNCFMATNIDALAIGDFLLMKEEQPQENHPDLESYLGRYRSD